MNNNANNRRCPIQMAAQTAAMTGNTSSAAVTPRTGSSSAAVGTEPSYSNIVPPVGNIPDLNVVPPLGIVPGIDIETPIGTLPGIDIETPIGTLPGIDITLPIGQLPDGWQTPGIGNCFSSASYAYAQQIHDSILDELQMRLDLLYLAMRSHDFAPTFRNLAAECLESARKLAVAYFLITGTYYWPTRMDSSANTLPFMQELRRVFNLARIIENNYRSAARQVNDRCLSSLYSILADTKVNQIGVLLNIIQHL